MCRLLKKVQHETHVTTLHVTHSLGEARRMADRVFILKEGTLHAAGPGELDQLLADEESSDPAANGTPAGKDRQSHLTPIPEAGS
jgi:ABC-type molybdate transport system ATPase subunit